MPNTKRPIGLAMTGASGAIYGLRLLEELLRDSSLDVHFTLSPSAQKVLRVEHDMQCDLENFDAAALGIKNSRRLTYHRYDNVAAPLASGSFRIRALAIVPCSMGCLGAIANGISDDLIQRAADVMLKERRPLVLVPRETPLSVIHLENMTRLARAGAVILPPAPGFYTHPQSVADVIDFVVARVLDQLRVSHALVPRWGDTPDAGPVPGTSNA